MAEEFARQGEWYTAQDGRRLRLGKAHADRARQFMPFAALTGYFDLIRERERVVEPFHELTEEEAAGLSRKMALVRKGMMLQVTFYDRDAYVTRTGVVSCVDDAARVLVLVKERIPFDMILDVRGEQIPEADL